MNQLNAASVTARTVAAGMDCAVLAPDGRLRDATGSFTAPAAA